MKIKQTKEDAKERLEHLQLYMKTVTLKKRSKNDRPFDGRWMKEIAEDGEYIVLSSNEKDVWDCIVAAEDLCSAECFIKYTPCQYFKVVSLNSLTVEVEHYKNREPYTTRALQGLKEKKDGV